MKYAVLILVLALLTGCVPVPSIPAEEPPPPCRPRTEPPPVPGAGGYTVFAKFPEATMIFEGPSENYTIIGGGMPSDTLGVYGRSPDGLWWRIEYENDYAWVRDQDVEITGEVRCMPIINRLPTPEPAAPPSP